MKRAFIIFLIYTYCGLSYGQKSIFGTTYFSSDSIDYMTKNDTLETKDILTLDFYRKHFFIPYNYPKHFVNLDYRDTTIVIWNNPDGEKDYKNNWTSSYTYDKSSKVIEYEYSGCFICSQLPYSLSIQYDKLNRPLRFESKTNLMDTKRKIPDEEFEFKYDIKGNVVQVIHRRFGKKDEQIDKL
jgi:hypothetical protein